MSSAQRTQCTRRSAHQEDATRHSRRAARRSRLGSLRPQDRSGGDCACRCLVRGLGCRQRALRWPVVRRISSGIDRIGHGIELWLCTCCKVSRLRSTYVRHHAATGHAFNSAPFSAQPPAVALGPPHCLKKNGTPAASHWRRTDSIQPRKMGRASPVRCGRRAVFLQAVGRPKCHGWRL